MKKLLSILLAVTMLVGAIVPSLAVSAAGEALAVAAPGAEHIATGASEFTSKVSITDNPGDLTYFQMVVWWDATVEADVTPVYDAALFNSTNSGITAGPALGNARAVKTYAGAFGVASADYYVAVVDFEAVAAINDAAMDVAELAFAFTAPIAAGDSFTYHVGLYYAEDSVAGEIAVSDVVADSAHTFVADADYAALEQEFAGQVLTIAANDVVFNKDTDTVATMKFFLLNNDVDGSNRTEFVDETDGKTYASGIGVWGMKFVLVYDNTISVGEASNGFMFEDTAINLGDPDRDETHETAVNAAKWAFSSFNFDINGSGKRFYIITFIPDDAEKDYYGNGLLCTVPFTMPESARVGDVYTINVMADLEDDVSNTTNWSIPFQTSDGTITVTGTQPACEHTNTKDVVKTEPTCTATGLKDVVCKDCNETVQADVEIPALGHDLTKVIPAVDATCTDVGFTEGLGCSRCDYVETAPTEIPALGHDEGQWVVVTEATTSSEGLEELRCTRDGAVLDSRVIPMITTPTIAASDANGYEGMTVKVPVTISNNHGVWAIKATFTSADLVLTGVESGLFTITEDSYSVADGVVTVFVDADGLEDVVGDGTLYTLVYTAPEAAGTYTVDVAVVEMINAASQDITCNLDAQAQVQVVACEHNYVGVVTVPPTAEAEGVMTYTCQICGKTYTETIPMLTSVVIGTDSNSKNKTVKVPVTIANNNGLWSLGMVVSYDAAALEFTGLESGLFTVDENSASAADGKITIFVDADEITNITENGVAFYMGFKVLTNETGDYALTAETVAENTINAAGDEVEVVPVAGAVTVTACAHEDTSVINVVTATCVTEGYTGDTVCNVCGDVIENGTNTGLDAENHEGDEVEATPAITATCVTEGFTASTKCSACNAILTPAVSLGYDAENHEGDEVEATPAITATCVTEGFTASTKCSACDAILTPAVSLGYDAANHEGNIVEATAAITATCVTEGFTASYKCDACDAITTPATSLGYDAENHEGNIVEATAAITATCVTEGFTASYKCDACDAITTPATSLGLDAENHEGDEVEATPAITATCVTEGFTASTKCSACDAILTPAVSLGLDAENHEGDEVEATPAITATCVTEGFTASTKCSACDAILTPAVSLGYDAANHEGNIVEATVAITATCVTEGFTASYKCDACDAITTPATSLGLDAENHEGEATWVITTPPTVDAEGLKELICGGCGATIDTEVLPALGLITKVSATEKTRSVSINGSTITVYAKNFADYVKFAIGKDGAMVVDSSDAAVSFEYHTDFSYVTVYAPNEAATITLRDANGYEVTYDIVVVYSDAGIEIGSKTLAVQKDGNNFTITASADWGYASFRFVFENLGYTFVEVDPEIESVRLPSGITWFKIFNDGTDTVVKTIKVADNKGVETVYTFTVNFVH